MSFSHITLGETDEQEAARLAQSPAGSRDHALSQLPVFNSMIENHRLYELAGMRGDADPATTEPCTGNNSVVSHQCNGTHRVVVVPIECTQGRSADGPRADRKHDDSWRCRVVYSDHPSCPAGGYDVNVSESELRRSPVVGVQI